MKKSERIIWISVVSLFLFLSLFTIFIKEARASNFDLNNKYLGKFLRALEIIENEYVEENVEKVEK